MRFPLGKMSVGDILDRGLKLLFGRLPAFYGINLLVLSPLIVAQVALPLVLTQASDSPMAMGLGVLLLVAVVLALLLQPIATAAIVHIVMREYLDKPATMGGALSFAMTRFPALLGTSILVGLVVIVGMVLCCLPGLYFLVTYAMVAQVVVLEKLSGSDAMNRSQKLISNYWWRVFGVLLITGAANQVTQVVLALGLEAVLPTHKIIPAGRNEMFPRQELIPLNHVIVTTIQQLANILFATYTAVCTTLVYFDLRIRKEGFDLELAAESGDYSRHRRDDRDEYDDRDRDRGDYDDRDRDEDDRRGRRRDRDDRDEPRW